MRLWWKDGNTNRELMPGGLAARWCISIFGANVFYFLSAPMMELAMPFEPFEPKALKQRREVAVHFGHGTVH